jgi:hypothetical protein
MVLQSRQDRDGNNGTGPLDRPTQGRILAQGQVRAHLSFPKIISDILMMQSGQDWDGDNDTGPLDCSMQGRIFL